MIILCINNNTTINNNCGRLQALILLFKITMSTLKNFFEIYRQFGYAPPTKARQPYFRIYWRRSKNSGLAINVYHLS